MAGRIAAPLELTTGQRQELTALIRAHSTPQKLAERARIIVLAADGVERERDSAAAWHMAQDGQHLAQTLAGGGRCEEHGGAFERRASLRGAGQIHAGAGLRHYRSGLRRSEG